MTHLDERLSALVDGELEHDERDRLLAHVAGCQPCRIELDGHRKVKSRLANSVGPDVPPALLAALLAMSEPGDPLPPVRRPVTGPTYPMPSAPPPRSARTDPSGRPVAARPGPAGPGRARSGRRRYIYVTSAGALSLSLIALGTAFAAGSATPGTGPAVTPPVDRFMIEHARTVGEVPFVDPAMTVIFGGTAPTGSPTAPAGTPTGMSELFTP